MRSWPGCWGAIGPWFGFGPDDVWAVFHSFAFDFSVWELWGPLLSGGRAVVVPSAVSRSPREVLALLAGQRVTVLNQTPLAFYQLMEADEAAGGADLAALRYVIFGGEALDPARLASWYARRPDRPVLVNMYGITETTVHVTYAALDRSVVAAGRRGSPIGRGSRGCGCWCWTGGWRRCRRGWRVSCTWRGCSWRGGTWGGRG